VLRWFRSCSFSSPIFPVLSIVMFTVSSWVRMVSNKFPTYGYTLISTATQELSVPSILLFFFWSPMICNSYLRLSEELHIDPHLWEPEFHLVNPVCHSCSQRPTMLDRVLPVDFHRISPGLMYGVYPFTRTYNRYPCRWLLCRPARKPCSSHVACIQLLSLLGF